MMGAGKLTLYRAKQQIRALYGDNMKKSKEIQRLKQQVSDLKGQLDKKHADYLAELEGCE